jgi:hypothetical protein
VRSLPNKSHKFVVIEYPGVVGAPAAPSMPNESQQQQQQASSGSSTPSVPARTQAHARSAAPHHTLAINTTTDLSHNPALARALQTLDPRPPALASPAGALAHLHQHLGMSDAVIECRIGSASAAAGSSSGAGSNGQAASSSNAQLASTELFRHPLHGHIVGTNDGVLRLRTRVWRRRRRAAAPTDAQGDSAMSATTDKDEVQVRHEHTAEILGLARHTLRFRQLADFAFEPAIASPPQQSGEEAAQDEGRTSVAATDIHEQTMLLMSALQRMDVAAMSNFRFMPESESWGNKDFMVTPPAFSITTVARKYGCVMARSCPGRSLLTAALIHTASGRTQRRDCSSNPMAHHATSMPIAGEVWRHRTTA